MKFLLDQPFLVYRAYQCPVITESHKSLIRSRIASYIYLKYHSSSSDLIPKYKSTDDVSVTVTSGNLTDSGTEITYIVIDEDVVQVVAFVKHADGIIALIRSHMPLFLIQMLESLDLEIPLVLQSLTISTKTIYTVIDNMHQLVRVDPNCIGNVDLVFTPKEKLLGDSLREILITIPGKDTRRILTDTQLLPLEALTSWLTDQTSVQFSNLFLKKFDSQILSLHTPGRLAIASDHLSLETTIAQVLAILCKSFNE